MNGAGRYDDLLDMTRGRIVMDCVRAGMTAEYANRYADAICAYLGLAVSNFAAYSSTLTTWEPSGGKPRGAFPRQAIPMTWDYTEVNPFGPAGIERRIEAIASVLERGVTGATPSKGSRA